MFLFPIAGGKMGFSKCECGLATFLFPCPHLSAVPGK